MIEAIKKYQVENSIVHPIKSDKLFQNVLFEFADAYMLLLDSAWHFGISIKTLLEYTQKKLEINKKRKWGKPDKNGVIEHINPPNKD